MAYESRTPTLRISPSFNSPESWIVVSAYTPQGFISNQPYDFGSILRMIEGVTHLTEGQLGFADIRATTDLSEFFTLTAPRACHLVPTATKALTADED